MLILSPLLLALGASAATFTVFDVPLASGVPEPSVLSFKALGVGNDGTTYEIAQAAPTGTLHQTIVADSAGIRASAAPQEGLPVGVIGKCTWGTSQNGVCVGEIFDASTTTTISYSGSITPLFTVTVDGSSASASPTSNGAAASPSPSNSAVHTLIGTRLYLGMAAASMFYLM